jgi:hypothetical protein
MADLILRCKDKRYPRSDWLLALTATGGQLTDAQQVQHAAFSHAEAGKRFIFPSFWQSIKDLRVVSDAGDTIWFVADSTAIAKIRGYLGIALATQGPAAIQAVKTKASNPGRHRAASCRDRRLCADAGPRPGKAFSNH